MWTLESECSLQAAGGPEELVTWVGGPSCRGSPAAGALLADSSLLPQNPPSASSQTVCPFGVLAAHGAAGLAKGLMLSGAPLPS